MASAGITKYDGKISENVLVLGSTGSGKMTLVQEMTSNSLFGELRGVHWISKLQLSKQRAAEIDSCFTQKVEFYSSQDEEDLKKLLTTSKIFTKRYREKDRDRDRQRESRKMDFRQRI